MEKKASLTRKLQKNRMKAQDASIENVQKSKVKDLSTENAQKSKGKDLSMENAQKSKVKDLSMENAQKSKMKDLPLQERPYERCLEHGAESLTDAQLLAVILRTGSRNANALNLASEILALDSPDGGILRLLHLSQEQLLSYNGVGKVKTVQMLCVGELSKRIWRKGHLAGQKSFQEPAAVAAYCREDMRHLEQEQVRALYFDTKQKLIRDMVLSTGTVNSAVISPREIFKQALQCNSVSLILVHNHPSGDPTPSQEDKGLTRRVKAAGEVLGILLLDHIIIGDTTYISFLNEGIL